MPLTKRLGLGVLHLLLAVLTPLPLRVLHGGGSALGALLARYRGRIQGYARINIDLCFADRTPEERDRLYKESFRELGKGMMELPAILRRSPRRLERWIQGVSGEERLTAAHGEGRGVILAVPHLGCWEILGPWVAARFPMTALYRPPREAAVEPILKEARARNGARLLPVTPSGIRGLLRALKEGEATILLPDQEPDGAEPFAPFFGQPAKTMTLLSRLAAKSGAPVLFVFAERLPKGGGFHIHILDADDEIASADLERATAALNRDVMRCVRMAPAQYPWTYRRFNTQPDGRRIYRRRPD